ncbi:hypothetical protein Tco_0504257, partial [Tanacetum coccineum]
MGHLVDCTKLDDWMDGVGWTESDGRPVDARHRMTLGPGREASDGRPRMDGTSGWRARPDKGWMEGTA